MASQSNGNHAPSSSKPTYESIMGLTGTASKGVADPQAAAVSALSNRLSSFRTWLADDAHATVSSAVCVVNGEATDGTKNAPVLVIGRPKQQQQSSMANDSSNSRSSSTSKSTSAEGRIGVIDTDGDQTLYDRTMGCQVRVVRTVEQGEVLLSIPRSTFVTPDLVASSDAGRAVLACIKRVDDDEDGDNAPSSFRFWDAFENTSVCEAKHMTKITRNTGPQLLVKILQERKKVEIIASKQAQSSLQDGGYNLADLATISTQAPLLAFIIHQRFSNDVTPFVQSKADAVRKQFESILNSNDANAFKSAQRIQRPPGSPDTFAPYARTLPSSVGVPLCWKRSELALFSSSIPGLAMLQEVAAKTLQLASDFMALMAAGLFERFPETFPAGLITWDRWVWAAAVVSARLLPANSYIGNKIEFETFRPSTKLEYQSPPEIWKELGVLIPLVDMLNHAVEENQVTLYPPSSADDVEDDDGFVDVNGESDSRLPRLATHQRVKKGSELFTCYGLHANHDLILQYGFAQLSNAKDQVTLGWGLRDSIGYLEPPTDYLPIFEDEGLRRFYVFETTNEEAVTKWWTEDRVNLLVKETSTSRVIESLKAGMKMTYTAYSDGSYHPIFLAALVVATMPNIDLQRHVTDKSAMHLSLTKRHQQVLQSHLAYHLSRKLEKLLQNVGSVLKDHFDTDMLWTSVTEGGLQYKGEGDEGGKIGWQSFIDLHVYRTTIKVENHYYAMGVDSCVLALLDGHLRALQLSLDGVTDHKKFQSGVIKQIQELGFELRLDDSSSSSEKKSPKSKKRNRGHDKAQPSSPNASISYGPTLKLHVGNLAFSTTPAEMFDYFSRTYGKDNIVECHIPVERETNRSRGFGFVTLPEALANQIIDSGTKHEMDGRFLKVARSNSTSSTDTNRAKMDAYTAAVSSNERCSKCGYRPKYCTCGPSKATRGAALAHCPPDYYRGDYGHAGDRSRSIDYRGVAPPSMPGMLPHGPYSGRDRYDTDYDRYSSGRPYDDSSRRGEYDHDWYGDRVRSRSPRAGSDEAGHTGERDYTRTFRYEEDERMDRRSEEGYRKRVKESRSKSR